MTIENQDELMLQAAMMYYQYDMTQDMIAKKLYVSRTKVSRLLKAAKESKKVEIFINNRVQRNRLLEQTFYKVFDLRDVVILSDLPETPEGKLDAVAEATAEYLDTILQEDTILGISRGRTLQAVASHLHPGRRLPVRVVQLVGLMNNPSQDEEEMGLARAFAKAYGGEYFNLFAPFILEDEEARKVLNHVAAVDKSLQMARDADVILTSLGHFSVNDRNILWNAYLEEEEKERLAEQNVAGLFCGYYYDTAGNILDTTLHKKIIGVPAKELSQKEQVIGTAAGKEKVVPILGALRGHLINCLITDEETALNVLIAEGKMV